jgi:hypothetical protein
MRIYVSIILLNLLTSIVFAQTRWTDGYLITSKGDTLRGQLSESQQTSYKVVFRSNHQSNPVTYTPVEIHRIHYSTGLQYEILVLPDFNIAAIWGEVLSDGKATLYRADNRFILRMNPTNEYHELKSETRTELVYGKSVKKEVYPYKGLLNYLFNDCDKVKQDIPGSTLTTSSLRSLVNKYNSCFGEIKSVGTRKSHLLKAGLLAGITSRTDKYTGSGEAVMFLTDNTYKSGTTFLWGALFQYYFSNRVNITVEAQLYNNSFTKSTTSDSEDNEVEYSYSSFQISILPQYEFREEGIVPYVMLGPTLIFPGSEKSYRKQDIKIPPSTVITNEFDNFYRPGPAFGLMAGAGL